MNKTNRFLVLILPLVLFLVYVNISAHPLEIHEDEARLQFKCYQGRLARDEIEAKVRDFIWYHWTRRMRGRVVVAFCGVDTSLKSTYIIRKSGASNWAVIEKFVEGSPVPFSKARVSMAVYHDVDRVEVTSTSETPKAIPAESDREPTSYRLRLHVVGKDEDLIL